MTLIENITTLTGFNDTAKVNIIIELTQKEISTYTKKVYDALTMDGILTEMTIFKIQKLGNEATKSLSFNGVNQFFVVDYPKNIMMQLDTLRRKVRLL